MNEREMSDALTSFLATVFSCQEIEGLAELHFPNDTWTTLPGGNASRQDVALAFVHALNRHGMIDASLFDRLASKRPKQAETIQALRSAWNIEDARQGHGKDRIIRPTERLRQTLDVVRAAIEYGLAHRALLDIGDGPPSTTDAERPTPTALQLARLLEIPHQRRWRVWCQLLAVQGTLVPPELLAALARQERALSADEISDAIESLRGLIGLVPQPRAVASPQGWFLGSSARSFGIFAGIAEQAPIYVDPHGEEHLGDPQALLDRLSTCFGPLRDGGKSDFRAQVEGTLLRGGELLPGGWVRYANQLDEGSSARVYEGTHVELTRKVAIKVSQDELDDDARQRFRREAELLARIQDPRVVGVIAHGETRQGHPYIIEDFIAGRTLSKQAAVARDPARAAQYLRWVREWGQGLLVAHSNNVVHRDIAPQNLMLRDDGSAIVIDFGLAGDYESGRTTRTRTHGTERFCPPNPLQGKPAGDVYALAASVLEQASGEAFHAANLGGLGLPLQSQLEVLHAAGQDGRELAAWLDACLHASAESGPQLLAAMVRQALPPGLGKIDRARRYVQRHPAIAAAGLATAMVLGLGLQSLRHDEMVAVQEAGFEQARTAALQEQLAGALQNTGERHVEAREFDFAALAFTQSLAQKDTPQVRGMLLRAASEPMPELLWRVAENGPGRGCFLSMDGSRVASVADAEVHVWNTRTGSLVGRAALSQPRSKHRSTWTTMNGPGDRMAFRYQDHVEFLDLTRGNRSRLELRGNSDGDGPVAWTSDQRLLMSTCRKRDKKDRCAIVRISVVAHDGSAVQAHVDITIPKGDRQGRTVSSVVDSVSSDGAWTQIAVALRTGLVIVVDDLGIVLASYRPPDAGSRNPRATLVHEEGDQFLVGFGGLRGLVTLDSTTGITTPVPVDPARSSWLGSISVLLRMPDGDLAIGGKPRCTNPTPFACESGYLMRISPEGDERWISNVMGEPKAVALDKDQLVLLGDTSRSGLLRIDATSGVHQDITISRSASSTDGKDRRVFQEKNAIVVTQKDYGRVHVRVRDLDSGELTAFADRAFGDLRWVDTVASGEMLVLDGTGRLFSLGEFGLEAREEILTGVPVPKRNERGLFAASIARFAAADASTAFIWTRGAGPPRQFPVPNESTQIAIFDDDPAMLVVDSGGAVNQYDTETGVRVHRWDSYDTRGYSFSFDSASFPGWIVAGEGSTGALLLDVVHGTAVRRPVGSNGQRAVGRSYSRDARWIWIAPEGSRASELVRYDDSPFSSESLMSLRWTDLGPVVKILEDRDELRLFSGIGDMEAWSLATPRFTPKMNIIPHYSEDEHMLWFRQGTSRDEYLEVTSKASGHVQRLTLPNSQIFHRMGGDVYDISNGARYVAASCQAGTVLWDLTKSERTMLMRAKEPGTDDWEHSVAFDRDARWLVFAAEERKLSTVSLDRDEETPAVRPSAVKFSDPILRLRGADRGRFLVQEGHRRLRVYSPADDKTGRAVKTDANIEDIYRAEGARFVIILTTGAVHTVELDASDQIQVSRDPLFTVRLPVYGYLQVPGILVTDGGWTNDGPSRRFQRFWELWSVATGQQLAVIGPWSQEVPLVRNGELWAVDGFDMRSTMSRESRIPLELLDMSPEELLRVLEHRRGRSFDFAEVKREEQSQLSIEAVPRSYVID